MIKKILLSLIIILSLGQPSMNAQNQFIQSWRTSVVNPVLHWFNTPSVHDPRVISLSTLGGFAGVGGLYIMILGIKKLMNDENGLPLNKQTKSYNTLKGALATLTGATLTATSVSGIILSTQIIASVQTALQTRQ